MKISVITPSIRPQYLNLTQEVLKNQTEQDFEWLVEIGIPERGHDLSASLNRMLKRAKGELVVMLQDCIKPTDTGLAQFWAHYEKEPTLFVTAPVGKVQDWKDEPKWDWRHFGQPRFIQPHQWEADWGSAPLKAFYDIGGYDEDYDQGWSWENVGVAWRAKVAGYEFMCDPTNTSVAIDHDAKSEHPFRTKGKNNDERSNATVQLALKGAYKLNFLDGTDNTPR